MAVHGSENPDINYITIDIKDEVLVLAKRNIEAAYEKKGHEIDNVALMSQEIALIDNMLGDGDEISRIYINFCNPWPKDRHKKRRLTHPRQIENYKKFAKTTARLDKVELFEAYKNSLLLVMDLQSHLIEQYNLKVTHDILERLLNYISE